MNASDIIILPSEDEEEKGIKTYAGVINFKKMLSKDFADDLEDIAHLYEYVSNPNITMGDKVSVMLRLHMLISKDILTNEQIDIEDVSVYRMRKEALKDLQGVVENLNAYVGADNFDVDHPVFSKSVAFIIEALLIAVKDQVDIPSFDSIVRDVSIALPGIESRIKNMVQDSSTEDILSLRTNPILEKSDEEKALFKSFILHRDEFKRWQDEEKSVPREDTIPKKKILKASDGRE